MEASMPASIIDDFQKPLPNANACWIARLKCACVIGGWWWWDEIFPSCISSPASLQCESVVPMDSHCAISSAIFEWTINVKKTVSASFKRYSMNRRLSLPDNAQQGDRNPPLPSTVLHKVITLFPFLRAIKLFKQDQKLCYRAHILYPLTSFWF